MKTPMSFKNLSQAIRYCHTKNHINTLSSKTRDTWKSVIGLEIHAQLSTKTKLFSSAPSMYGAPTNCCVSLFDAAIPGTLPSLNKTAVELAVLSALALNCKINPVSYFDRKHYFYSDLPAGYQITQQNLPLAENGKVDYAVYQPGAHSQPYYKTSKIRQIQLEQDSGKSLYEHTKNQCYVDLNRAGIALIEIVFEPDIEDGEEACALVKEVISILERTGACSCKLQEGALRVDANVSVHKNGKELGVRTEIKNIGSLHGVSKAIRHEVTRQLDIIKNGGVIKNQTLTWDPSVNKVIVLRDKEDKLDYRFMPEPNLPPLRLIIDEYSEGIHKNVKFTQPVLNLQHLKKIVPTLPHDERILLMKKYGLNDIFAYNLVNQSKLFTYFREIMLENSSRDPKITYLLLLYRFLNALKSKNLELDECSVSTSYLGQVVDLLQTRRISKMTCNELLEEILDKENCLTPIEIVEKKNLGIISNPKELRKICLKVFERENTLVTSYRRKKKKGIFNELFKYVLEETKFRADTEVLPNVMTELLNDMDDNK